MHLHVEPTTNASPVAHRRYPEIERLIGNAVCDPGFAEVLLRDPQQALKHGGYHLRMTHYEAHLVLSIHDAADLREFAMRLYQEMQNGQGEALKRSSVEAFERSHLRAVE